MKLINRILSWFGIKQTKREEIDESFETPRYGQYIAGIDPANKQKGDSMGGVYIYKKKENENNMLENTLLLEYLAHETLTEEVLSSTDTIGSDYDLDVKADSGSPEFGGGEFGGGGASGSWEPEESSKYESPSTEYDSQGNADSGWSSSDNNSSDSSSYDSGSSSDSSSSSFD